MPTNYDSRYESSGAGFGRILLYGALLLIVAGLFLALNAGIIGSSQAVAALGKNGMSEPALVVEPGRSLQVLHAREDSMLNSYGWVDKDAGIGRIPVDRAIELLAEQGFPVR